MRPGATYRQPQLSPIDGGFTGAPLASRIGGTRDLFLSKTARTHRKLRAAGIEAGLQRFEGLSHVQYLAASGAPETRRCTARGPGAWTRIWPAESPGLGTLR